MHNLTGFWGWYLSKLRGYRALTRNDLKAQNTLLAGINRFYPNLRFMTLTCVDNFKKNFRKLKQFLKKKTVLDEYFAVRTGEGSGVIHMVFTGKSIRYSELSKAWQEISGAWNVSISKVRNVEGVVREMTRQHRVIRYFHSRNWCQPAKTMQSDFNGDLQKEVYRETSMKFLS